VEESHGSILIVDDHPRNVAILVKILAGKYRVTTAASGEEALASFSDFHPDLVLLDVMMPGIDGYETCRRLRSMREGRAAKILMVSAKAMVSERIVGYEAGADDYIVKPFDELELLAKVRVYMRLKSVEELGRIRAEMLTLVNHETRTPLTGILSSIDLMLHLAGDADDDKRNLLLLARDGALRLGRFIDAVGFLTELQGDSFRYYRETIDCAGLANSAIDALAPLARERDVEIRKVLDDGIRLECDADQVGRALGALLHNAIRLSPSPGAVEVRLEARRDHALLSVRDEGPGVPPSFLSRIFEGLAVPDIAHHVSGSGLSLAIARAIVRGHGGAMTVENRPGGGAEFCIRLPMAPATSASPPVETPAGAPDAAAEPAREAA
jgi:signal transduction histidine kinase